MQRRPARHLPALQRAFEPVEAVLFDLDGTLIDTDDTAVETLSRRLRPILGQRAPRVARRLLMDAETPGNALVTLLDWLHLDELLMGATDWLRRRRGVYSAEEFRLIPGVEEAVARLGERYPVGLVTTRSRYHIDRFLEQFPVIAGVVRTSCGLQDTRRLKPHPAPIQEAARRLDVAVAHCVMVGDTPVDIRSAVRAGAWGVGVLSGFGRRNELLQAGAHVILPSSAELTTLLLR